MPLLTSSPLEMEHSSGDRSALGGSKSGGSILRSTYRDVICLERERSYCGIVFGGITRAGIKYDGTAKTNQDAYLIQEGGTATTPMLALSVFDGHGPTGELVSNMATECLPFSLAKNLGPGTLRPQGVSKAFTEVDRMIMSYNEIDTTYSGCTATMVIRQGSKLHCANVGDSRCLLGSMEGGGKVKVKPLSNEHAPDVAEEAKRVRAAGGRIERAIFDGERQGPLRIYKKDVDLPGITVTRAFGDDMGKSLGLIADPEIISHDLGPEDKYLVLCSDGITEFIGDQELMGMVHRHVSTTGGNLVESAARIIEEARRRWQVEEDGISDDCTLLLGIITDGRGSQGAAARNSSGSTVSVGTRIDTSQSADSPTSSASNMGANSSGGGSSATNAKSRLSSQGGMNSVPARTAGGGQGQSSGQASGPPARASAGPTPAVPIPGSKAAAAGGGGLKKGFMSLLSLGRRKNDEADRATAISRDSEVEADESQDTVGQDLAALTPTLSRSPKRMLGGAGPGSGSGGAAPGVYRVGGTGGIAVSMPGGGGAGGAAPALKRNDLVRPSTTLFPNLRSVLTSSPDVSDRSTTGVAPRVGSSTLGRPAIVGGANPNRASPVPLGQPMNRPGLRSETGQGAGGAGGMFASSVPRGAAGAGGLVERSLKSDANIGRSGSSNTSGGAGALVARSGGSITIGNQYGFPRR